MTHTMAHTPMDLVRQLHIKRLKEFYSLPQTFEIYEAWINVINRPAYTEGSIKKLQALLVQVAKKELMGDFVDASFNPTLGTIFIRRNTGTTIFCNGSSEFVGGTHD